MAVSTTADLSEYGFVEAGSCALDSRLKSGVRFTLNRHQSDRVLYAFVVDDEVKYIGACDDTKTCFSDRMSRYQGIMGAGTNARVVGFMREVLDPGKAQPSAKVPRVRVFAWHPQERVTVKGLNVDLVMGLEKPLIERFKPEWNRRR